MKRIVIFILAVAALFSVGCNKQEDFGPKSTYKITVDRNAEIRLPDGITITTTFYPKTVDEALSSDITVTFKADPSKLADYPDKAVTLLPETNYTFKKNPVVVEAERRFDPTGREYCRLDLRHTTALKPETTYVLPIVIESITGNGNALFDPDDVLYIVVKTNRPGAGCGTEDVPYVIETIDDLKMMDEYAIAGQLTYFKLMNDLDFSSSANWEPVCLTSDNPMYVDFNGDNKTFSNFSCTDTEKASIFGYVCGNIYDLKIDKATVTAQTTANDIAILANSIGSSDENCPSECSNISITNSKVEANTTDLCLNQAFVSVYAVNATFKNIVLDRSNTMKLYFYASSSSMSNGAMAGGLVARASNVCNFIQCGNTVDLLGYNQKQIGGIVGSLLGGHISECWNTGNVEGNEDVAGIVGQIGSKKGSNVDVETWTVTNCYNKGQIRITGQRGGGICGCPFNSVKIEKCYNVGDVLAMCRRTQTGEDDPENIDGRCIGGIAGHVCGGAGFWDFNIANDVSIIDCHVYSDKVMADTRKKTNAETDPRPGCGAIVGYTSLVNTYTDCYRSSSTTVDNSKTQDSHNAFDQGNCGPGNPLNTGSITPVQKRAIPYHGVENKTAATITRTSATIDNLIEDFFIVIFLLI